MALVLNDRATSGTLKTELSYDPTSGSWVPVSVTSSSNVGNILNNIGNSNTSSSNKTPSTEKTGSSSSNVDSKEDAEKELIDAEFNILTGELRVTPTSKSIRVKVNDTVKIEGLGKYLSGLYFVSSVSRTVDSSGGYSHSFTLLKNGFGSSVKESSPDTEVETRKEEVVKDAPEYKVGDSVKIVGEDAVYSNAHDGVKVPEWVKKKTLTIRQISDDKTRVLLMPIYSWTYVKYIHKV